MAPAVVESGAPIASHADIVKGAEPSTLQQPGSNPHHEEHQYLDLIRDILDNGEHRPDRTGTGTYSLFAPRQLRFSLSRPSTDPSDANPIPVLPLITTKRVFLRAVIAELLWFVSGDTSAKTLQDQNVHIWDGNGSREFLDKAGLSHREEGDLGPVYGFQWRHFGARYVDYQTDYSGQGVDQLAELVRKIRDTPWDRRIILSAWNPADMGKMALPPCHMFAQFYVSFPSKTRRKTGSTSTNGANCGASTPQTGANMNGKDAEANGGDNETQKEQGVLHAVLYQRSCDMGLGVPFNIVSYALLTHMLAHVCDLIPGSLTHCMGDAHVYLDHVEALEGQLEREPKEFPTLNIKRPKGEGRNGVSALEGWKADDFEVIGYTPHKAVPMKMSV